MAKISDPQPLATPQDALPVSLMMPTMLTPKKWVMTAMALGQDVAYDEEHPDVGVEGRRRRRWRCPRPPVPSLPSNRVTAYLRQALGGQSWKVCARRWSR